jgi:hypothetical protein
MSSQQEFLDQVQRQKLLDQVQHNVDKVRRLVDRQRWLIAKMEADGQDSEVARHLLIAFERSQELFERDLTAVLKEQSAQ